MKILNWYITKSFLITFGMAMLILTSGMTGARIAKVMDVIVNGVPIDVFFKFIFYVMPVILTYTIPWSILAAVMLIFGRLSADHEITAMRACGISILQVVSPIMLIVFAISGFCLFMHLELSPIGLLKSRTLMRDAAVNQPMAMFEPGRPLHYGNMIIYIDDKIGKDKLKNVQIYVVNPKDKEKVAQDITATEGVLQVDEAKKVLTIVLKNCLTINKADREVSRLVSDELRFFFDFGESSNGANLFRAPKYMSFNELIARIRMAKKMTPRNPEMECSMEVELNKRIAFALSPIAFLLLGIPLAIRTNRRETSVGLFLSVILAGVFFLLIIFAQSLTGYPKLYPQYLLWLPNILFQFAGAIMTYRISQR